MAGGAAEGLDAFEQRPSGVDNHGPHRGHDKGHRDGHFVEVVKYQRHSDIEQ